MKNRSLMIGILVFVVSALSVSPAFSCVGARPLSMGGAFTGLADDVNATYWNPAGLVNLDGPETTWMHTTMNREDINYQDYVAHAQKIGNNTALGVSYINYNYLLTGQGPSQLDNQNWYWVSLAVKVDPKTSVGVNLRKVENSIAGMETSPAIDVAFLHKVDDKLTIGMLVQNANEPAMKINGEQVGYWGRNWRPGASYKIDDTQIASIEFYDIGSGKISLRIGYELDASCGAKIRVGYYELGSTQSTMTIGAGKSIKLSEGSSIDIDVAGMFGDFNTVLVSATLNH